jgi:hypothetical protein
MGRTGGIRSFGDESTGDRGVQAQFFEGNA